MWLWVLYARNDAYDYTRHLNHIGFQKKTLKYHKAVSVPKPSKAALHSSVYLNVYTHAATCTPHASNCTTQTKLIQLLS